MAEVRKHQWGFTPEYRVKVTRLVVGSDRPIAYIAQGLGLVKQTLCRWIHSYRQTMENEPDGELMVDEHVELRRLRREIEEPRKDNEFLGKVATQLLRRSDHW